MITKDRNFLEPAGLFFASFLFFTWGLGNEEIIGFESRFYYFALEMWRSGFTWFPTTYHHPYPDYPVTSTLLINIFAKIYGGLNKFVAVLPSAIAASLTVSLTYMIGALYSKRWGIFAVFFMILTIAFLRNARSIALDMYPTLATACCFYIIHSANLLKKKNRAFWIYLFLIFGFAFRGPIGLIIPAGVICTYYVLDKDYKRFFFTGVMAFLLLFLCLIILLTLAHHVGGNAFLLDVLHMEAFGRIDNAYLPFYFYFVNSFTSYALSYPIAWLVLIGLYQYTKRPYSPELKFLIKLAGWALVILLGMSIPGDKKIRYILPMTPAIALIAAYLFITPNKEKFFKIIQEILVKLFLYLPAIFLLGTELVFHYAKVNKFFFQIAYWHVAFILIAMQLFSFLIVYQYIDKKKLLELLLAMMATFTVMYIYLFVIEPVELYFDRAHDFVAAVEDERLKKHAILVFYKEKPDGLPIKYLLNAPREEKPIFVNDANQLSNFSQPVFVVTSVSYFVDLPNSIKSKFRIVATDMLGHVKVIVLTNQ